MKARERGENRNVHATPRSTAEPALDATQRLDFLAQTSVNPEDLTRGAP